MATDGPFSEDETQLHPRSPSEHGCPGAGCARDGSDEAPPPPVTVSEVIELVREIDKHYPADARFVPKTPEEMAAVKLLLSLENEPDPSIPLLKLGPGGEYVKEVWPEDLQKKGKP